MSDEHDNEGEPPRERASGDYEVGYGKPPKQHQFQPGNQNARKRKKPAEQTISLAAAIERAVGKKITVKRGEKVIKLSAADVLSERLVQGIARGSLKEMITIFGLIEQHAPGLLKVTAPALEVIYRHAAGSGVSLPPVDLYDEEPQK